MNISRRYSISVCFVYGLNEKDSKSEVIFAVCRLPLTSCLTSLISKLCKLLPIQGLAATELEDGLGVTRNNLDIDQENRERQITKQLKSLDAKLKKELTSLLQVPEVKEDKLKTAVKLDLLTKLSESLQNMYSDIQAMVAETCKCNEDLKREFYDFAYHGLRAEHNDLVLRVKDLESLQAEMSKEEQKALERLQQYQKNRQRQIDRLENVWRGLFSSVRKHFML